MEKDKHQEMIKEFAAKQFHYGYFQSLLAFANAGSVAGTASGLKKDSSTVSRDITKLEDAFGFTLRQYNGRVATLSPAGEQLVPLIRRQIEELKHFKDEQFHSINLAGGDFLLHLMLLPKLEEIQKDFPKSKITVSSHSTFEIIEGLKNFSLDLGLLTKKSLEAQPKGKKNKLEGDRVGAYDYYVFARKALCHNGLIQNDLEMSQLPFAIIKSHWSVDFLKAAEEGGIEFNNVRVVCENFTQIFQLVRMGSYAGILPIFCKSLLPADTVLYPPKFLNGEKHEVVLAWNPQLAWIKKGLEDFKNTAVEHLESKFAFGN